MITNWSVVLLTYFAELSSGISLYAFWRHSHDIKPPIVLWKFALVSSAAAFLSSFFAFNGISHSSSLIIQSDLFLLLILLFLQNIKKYNCGLLICLTGILSIFNLAYVFVPGQVFTFSGLYPFALFLISSLILGAAVSQIPKWDSFEFSGKYGRFYVSFRIFLWCFLIMNALIPCIHWIDIYMEKSAVIFMQTQLFWAAVISSGVSLGLSHMGKITLNVQAAVVLFGMLAILTAFFADGVYGTVDMSTLYLP